MVLIWLYIAVTACPDDLLLPSIRKHGPSFGLKQLHANATALLPNVATCISGVVTFGLNDQVSGRLAPSRGDDLRLTM